MSIAKITDAHPDAAGTPNAPLALPVKVVGTLEDTSPKAVVVAFAPTLTPARIATPMARFKNINHDCNLL